jgi:hypothetical protein
MKAVHRRKLKRIFGKISSNTVQELSRKALLPALTHSRRFDTGFSRTKAPAVLAMGMKWSQVFVGIIELYLL